jgi:hypothetical protein
MPVILGNQDCVSAWLNDASVKLEEITTPYEGADLVSPHYVSCYQYIHCLLNRCYYLQWPVSSENSNSIIILFIHPSRAHTHTLTL